MRDSRDKTENLFLGPFAIKCASVSTMEGCEGRVEEDSSVDSNTNIN
jgi:hypothetical protein